MSSPRGPYRKNHPDTCSIEGCGRPFYGKGWCAMHYMRWRRTGDPLLSRIDRQNQTWSEWRASDKPRARKLREGVTLSR